MDEGSFFTVEKVCVVANCGYGKVRRAVKSGDLPALRVGRRLLITPEALAGWLTRRPTTPEEKP